MPASSRAEEASKRAYQPALQGKDYGKSEMSYGDFTKTPSGLSYKDAKPGTGKAPVQGDRCVVEWTGYTIGYFGRPFETKKLQELDGKDDGFLRFVLCAHRASSSAACARSTLQMSPTHP